MNKIVIRTIRAIIVLGTIRGLVRTGTKLYEVIHKKRRVSRKEGNIIVLNKKHYRVVA